VGRRWIHDHKLVVNVKEMDEDFAEGRGGRRRRLPTSKSWSMRWKKQGRGCEEGRIPRRGGWRVYSRL
jgi:hypothetical protein